nr:MAG TPA_asm: hypothetical protein [Caudoviricetes sp.]
MPACPVFCTTPPPLRFSRYKFPHLPQEALRCPSAFRPCPLFPASTGRSPAAALYPIVPCLSPRPLPPIRPIFSALCASCYKFSKSLCISPTVFSQKSKNNT